jgi:uncharacterized membrane protein
MFTFLALIGLALWASTLAKRLSTAELRLHHAEQAAAEARAKSELVTRLTARVAVLEEAARGSAVAAAPVVAPPPVAKPEPRPSPTPAPAQTPAPNPPPLAVPAAPVAVAPTPLAAPPPVTAPSTAPTPSGEEAWEVTVGGSWLNKIGVLVFVIGIALLVGYSVTRVGPAGRIAIGFIVSLGMLGAGVVLERRDEYRTYAYGLIAGGWAGTYFTTYAMRAVPAARVIDSDVVAIVLLSAVAAGMVWHSLRYRSQEVTALAYVVAYATLALTPLVGFSLLASIPLAMTLMIVAQRFGWTRLQVLGIVFTYGLYAVRGQSFGFGALNTTAITPYLALAAYWVMFEAADLLAIRRRPITGAAPPPVFILNAAGLIGSGLLQLPSDAPLPLSTFLLVSGGAYLASAVARARLGAAPTGPDALDRAVHGSYQGATALAVAFVAWAIVLRFDGPSLVIALLLEAELVFLSGLILRDHVTRGIGSALAILVGLLAIGLIGDLRAASLGWVWSAQGPAAAAALTGVTWYANREWLRSRQIPLLRHEWLFTPVATYLVVLIARAEWPIGYSSLATLVFSLGLLEAGLRRGVEYRYQAYAAGAASALVLLVWFGAQGAIGASSTREAWTVLMTAMVVAYTAAWRIAPAKGSSAPDRRQRAWAAAIAGSFGTAFVVMLEWIVIAPDFVTLAWAATAATIGVAGLHWKLGGLRWQMYPLLGLALLRAMEPVLDSAAARPIEVVSAVVVIGFLYAFSLAVREAVAHREDPAAQIEDAVRIAMSLVATLSVTALIFCEVRSTLVTVSWGIHGSLLLAAGFPARERVLRLSGLTVLLACIGRLFLFDLPQLEELARIVSFVALGAVLLTVSWFYTRYRARLQKYL